MATTNVSNAVVVPQSKGTGLGLEDDMIDAASAALLSEYVGGEYVGSGMEFTRDNGNDQIDVAPGYCYVIDDSSAQDGTRSGGGNAQIQSTATSGYDTEIPTDFGYVVIFPTSVSVSVTDNTDTQIWVNITDVGSNNSVEVRSSSGGGTTSQPGGTFLELGTVNDSGSGDPIARPNDYPSKDFDTATFHGDATFNSNASISGDLNDGGGNAMLGGNVASGSVTLSSGAATIDTGVSESTTATFFVAIGPDTDDSEVAASIQANSGGNYTVHIDEINTSVGNPTINYDIIRVR